MPDRSSADLVEIEDAIKRIRYYVTGLDQASFLVDAKTCDAVSLQLLVIDEAARRLPDSARQEEANVLWGDIISVRNRIAHGYWSIDHSVVWNIVAQHLPSLEAAVIRMLAARGE